MQFDDEWRKGEEAAKFVHWATGHLYIPCDHDDPADVEAARAHLYEAVDREAALYPGNEKVAAIAAHVKQWHPL